MTQAFNLAQLANNLNTSGQLDATDGLSGVVPVANGGSGRSTLTANNILIGNGTGAINFVAPGTSGNVLTSNGTSWTSVAGGGLGIGQTWQNLTGSRSSGTTYTNSTGKPIAVGARSNFNRQNDIVVTVDGVETARYGIENNFFIVFPVFVIVPNGSTYSITIPGGIGVWSELR